MPIENSKSGDNPVLAEVSSMESIIPKGGTPKMKEIIIAICLTAKEILIEWPKILAMQAKTIFNDLDTLQKILAGFTAVISGIIALFIAWWKNRN